MKMKTLVAATVMAFLATSFAYAAPTLNLVDDMNSTSSSSMGDDAMATPGPLADANSAGNIGAIPPSTAGSSDNTASANPGNLDPQASTAMNNMEPQNTGSTSSD